MLSLLSSRDLFEALPSRQSSYYVRKPERGNCKFYLLTVLLYLFGQGIVNSETMYWWAHTRLIIPSLLVLKFAVSSQPGVAISRAGHIIWAQAVLSEAVQPTQPKTEQKYGVDRLLTRCETNEIEQLKPTDRPTDPFRRDARTKPNRRERDLLFDHDDSSPFFFCILYTILQQNQT